MHNEHNSRKNKTVKEDILIHETGVNFPKATVTGKTIDSEEVKVLLSHF